MRPFFCLLLNLNLQYSYIHPSKHQQVMEASYLPLLERLTALRFPSHWFVTGVSAERIQGGLLSRVHEALMQYLDLGYGWVENYTYSHSILPFYPGDEVDQIRLGEEALAAYSHRIGTGFLPPEYALDGEGKVLHALRAFGKRWVAVAAHQVDGTEDEVVVRHAATGLYLIRCNRRLKRAVELAMLHCEFAEADALIARRSVILSIDAETLFFNLPDGRAAFFGWLEHVMATHDVVDMPTAIRRVGQIRDVELTAPTAYPLAPWEEGEAHLRPWRNLARPWRDRNLRAWLLAQNSDGLLLPHADHPLMVPAGRFLRTLEPFLANLRSLLIPLQEGWRDGCAALGRSVAPERVRT